MPVKDLLGTNNPRQTSSRIQEERSNYVIKLCLAYLKEHLLQELPVWFRVESVVKVEQRPRTFQAVPGKLQLVHRMNYNIRNQNYQLVLLLTVGQSKQ